MPSSSSSSSSSSQPSSSSSSSSSAPSSSLLPTPTGLVCGPSTATTISARWNALPGFTYQVNLDSAEVTTVAGGSVTVTGLPGKTSFRLAVRAIAPHAHSLAAVVTCTTT